MSELQIGDRVRIIEGWWVSFHDPIVDPTDMGTQSDGTLAGTVTKEHAHSGTLYVTLDSGRLVSTAKASLEIGDANGQ